MSDAVRGARRSLTCFVIGPIGSRLAAIGTDTARGDDRNRTGVDGFAERPTGVFLAFLCGFRGSQVPSDDARNRWFGAPLGRLPDRDDSIAGVGTRSTSTVGWPQTSAGLRQIVGDASSASSIRWYSSDLSGA
jgi:hypothetical protein